MELAAFRRGDGAAFDEIYRRYQRPIAKYVRQRIRDEEVAIEVVQEVFLKVFRYRDSYQERYAFSTWLWAIARNAVFDHLRGIQGDPRSEPPAGGAEPICPSDLPSPLKCAETLALRKDQGRHLLRLARSLTRMQRKVIWMRVVHQFSYPEIAARLGLSQTAVKNLAHRAKLGIAALQLA